MILNASNCNNPLLWGKNIQFVIDGELVNNLSLNIPTETDFLKLFFPNTWPEAKEYYKDGTK